MSEENLEKQFKTYVELAKTNKNIDVSALMLDALKQHEANYLSPKEKRIAYLVSLAFPPFGLLFAARFFVSEKEDGKSAAYVCVGLTLFTAILFWLILSALVGSSGVTPQHVEQLRPSDWRDLY